MLNFHECFKKTYSGPVRGDECSHTIYEAIKPVTVQELCDYIISNKNEWGYIGISYPGTVFGNPNVEYSDGQYVDRENNPIEFKFPPDIASKIVKRIDWTGGWSRADWLFTI